MSYNLAYRPRVKWDIQDIFDYYKSISPKLAEQLLFRVKEATDRIISNPLGFQIKYNTVRTLLINQFPYQIHYITDEGKQLVTVLAIVHSYRSPTDYSTL